MRTNYRLTEIPGTLGRNIDEKLGMADINENSKVYRIEMPPVPSINIQEAASGKPIFSKHNGKCDRCFEKAAMKRRKKNKNPKTHRRK